MEGQMHLSGQLSDWSINDLLQIMQVTKKTGSLDIDGERRGRIHFNDGKVTGAELTGASGSYKGSDRAGVADILYVLSTLNEGDFAVGETDGPDGPGWGVEDVLADVEALESLEGEVIDAGLFEATGVRFAQSIDTAITDSTVRPRSVMSLSSRRASLKSASVSTKIFRSNSERSAGSERTRIPSTTTTLAGSIRIVSSERRCRLKS